MKAPTMLPGTEPIIKTSQKKLEGITASASNTSGTQWLSVADYSGYSPIGIAGFGLSNQAYFTAVSFSTDTTGKRVGINLRNVSSSQRTTDCNFLVILMRDELLG